ncbi:MAG: transposase zinc-binding domain-containing protein [Candidatus Aminicenantales bacterium]
MRCPDCGEERLLMFSCLTRGFCPSCHAKHLEEWGEWMRESLLLDVPHLKVVFTIPKMLRIFFKYKRGLLGELCRLAVNTLTIYFRAITEEDLTPGIIASIQTFGQKINFHPFPGDRGRGGQGRSLPQNLLLLRRPIGTAFPSLYLAYLCSYRPHYQPPQARLSHRQPSPTAFRLPGNPDG